MPITATFLAFGLPAYIESSIWLVVLGCVGFSCNRNSD